MEPASAFKKFLDVHAADPDDARRRRLINVLLLYGVALSFLVAIVSLISAPQENTMAYLRLLSAVLFAGIIYAVNRRSGDAAGWLLVLSVTLSIVANPESATGGRGMVALAVPILIAGFVLHPFTSFVVAGLIAVLVPLVGIFHVGFDITSVMFFLAIALVTWSGARSLEQLAKNARAAMLRSQAAIDTIADGVLLLDANGRVITANPAVANLLGCKVEEIAGRTLESLLGSDAERVAFMMPGLDTLRWRDKVLTIRSAKLPRSVGQPGQQVVTLHDVTLERQLQRARQMMLSTAAHELRTPLNAILGIAQLMQREAGRYDINISGMPLTALVERLLLNGEQLMLLVNNLLETSRMEAGDAKPKKAQCSPREVVGAACLSLEVLAREKGLRLNVQIDDNVPTLLTSDPRWVQQMITNLVGNAIKFTDTGEVSVYVYLPDTEHWAIQVKDTGPGIPLAEQATLFQPFSLGRDPVTRSKGGAGLGLYIVKQMCDRMGGEIRLESEENEGSTFTIILPLDPHDVVVEFSLPVDRRPQALVLEPHKDQAFIFTTALQPNFRAKSMPSSRTAMEWLKVNRPALALLHVDRADSPAAEVVRFIRSTPGLSDTYIAVATTSALEEIDEIVRLADDAWVLPLGWHDLCAKVKKWTQTCCTETNHAGSTGDK